MPRVRQILFVAPAPVVWAQHLGLLQSAELEVETTQTTSSDQMGQGLADGTFDVGIGVMDNVFAWNAERHAGLKMLAQLERSQPMALCAAASCKTLEDAARGAIAVDAVTNGFVLVLYRALARAGIDRAACRFESVGGVRHRYEALIAGKAAATILVPPFIDMAVAAGCHVLWRGSDLAPTYPGVVATARARWIDVNRPAALAYVRALARANAWAGEPAHRDEVVAALVGSRYSEAAARGLVDARMARLEPSRAGWEEVIALRREAGLFAGAAPAFESAADLALLREATA
jgi:ABC-type nitrate/sulfonate/bicarbonate transport system substrate-binding protein